MRGACAAALRCSAGARGLLRRSACHSGLLLIARASPASCRLLPELLRALVRADHPR
jgi:hypothetical protein